MKVLYSHLRAVCRRCGGRILGVQGGRETAVAKGPERSNLVICPRCGRKTWFDVVRCKKCGWTVADGSTQADTPADRNSPDAQAVTRLPVADVSARIATLKAMGEWGGVLVSKRGDTVIYLHGGLQVPVGEWLYFLYHLETLPDRRIVFSDAACLWLTASTPFVLTGYGNMYYPVPPGIDELIGLDQDHAEWAAAFRAVDNYFSKSDGWKHQWSWRTARVKHFMSAGCSDWSSSIRTWGDARH